MFEFKINDEDLEVGSIFKFVYVFFIKMIIDNISNFFNESYFFLSVI